MRHALAAGVLVASGVIAGCGGGGDSAGPAAPGGTAGLASPWLGNWSGTLQLDGKEGNACDLVVQVPGAVAVPPVPPATTASLLVAAKQQPDGSGFDIAVSATSPIGQNAHRIEPLDTGSEIKFGDYTAQTATVGVNSFWQLDLQPDGTMLVKYVEGQWEISGLYCNSTWSGIVSRSKT